MTNTEQPNPTPAPIMLEGGRHVLLIASSFDGGGVYTQGLEYANNGGVPMALHAWIGSGDLDTDEHLRFRLTDPRAVVLPTGEEAEETALYTHDGLPRTWWDADSDMLTIDAPGTPPTRGIAYHVVMSDSEA